MARRGALYLLALVAACGDSETAPPAEPGTWYGEVGAIVRTKCAGCHHEGGVAPFSLHDYGEATEQMGKMVEAIDKGIMPPWYANDPEDCTPKHRWLDDARLTDAESAAIHVWVAADGPEGTPRELPEIRSTSLDYASVEVGPMQPFTSAGELDQFVCFLFDPQITTTRWITGSQVYPTKPDLVHHVNVYLIGPAQAEQTKAWIGGVGVPALPCDHPPGVAIHSWLPGNPALVLPESVGIPVDPGTLVLTQVHYHPAGVGGTDATSVALRLTDDKPTWRYSMGVYGNAMGAPALQPGPGDPNSGPAFLIPANSEDHVEHMIIQHPATLPQLRVLTVTPHMHLLGTHQRATLTHGDGERECLIDSRWSFDWQRSYAYDAELAALPLLDGGSKVEVSCRWNNTFSNPEMPRLLEGSGRVAPYDVSLGFTTTDEMCLLDVGVVSPY